MSLDCLLLLIPLHATPPVGLTHCLAPCTTYWLVLDESSQYEDLSLLIGRGWGACIKPMVMKLVYSCSLVYMGFILTSRR